MVTFSGAVQVGELESLMVLAENPGTAQLDLVGLLLAKANDPWHQANPLRSYMAHVGDNLSWDVPSLRRETRAVLDLVRDTLLDA